MVVTRADPFPKPIRLVERSKVGKTIELLLSERLFFVPSGFLLLEELSVSSLFEYSYIVLISDSESYSFIRVLITRFFYCKVKS